MNTANRTDRIEKITANLRSMSASGKRYAKQILGAATEEKIAKIRDNMSRSASKGLLTYQEQGDLDDAAIDRLPVIREAVLTANRAARKAQLAKDLRAVELTPYQKELKLMFARNAA